MNLTWTQEENARLRDITPRYSSWIEIAKRFPGRNNEACRNRAKRMGITGLLGQETRLVSPSLAPDSTPPALANFIEASEIDAEAILDAIEVIQGLIEQADPVTTHATVEIDTDRPIGIMFSSCGHIGSRYTEYPKFRDLFRRTLETPNIYWGTHGDYTDNFMVSFRNAQPVLSQLIHPKFQRALAGYIIESLADAGRLLYGCAGNHEEMTVRVIGEDLMAPYFQRRSIPYFTGKGCLDLYVGAERYVLGVAHQWPGSSYFNPAHPQVRALLNDLPSADIIAGGHKHEFAYMERGHHLMEHDAGHFPSPTAHLIAIGTAASKPDPYAIRGWSRGEFEWPLLALYPDRHKIKRIYDWDDIEHFLKL